MSDMVLRGVTLPDGQRTDLVVCGTKLADEAAAGARVIDVDGLIALPGLVDPHCHLREPGSSAETIASGTAAAARGGYTAVAAMPNTTPACNGPTEARWLRRRAKDAAARVIPIGAVTHDRAGQHLADLGGLGAAGVRLFSDDGAVVATADLLRQAMLAIAPFHGTIADHCQDPTLAASQAWRPDCPEAPTVHRGIEPLCNTTQLIPDADQELWPAKAETTIVERDIQAAADTGQPVHLCHLSCAESVDMVRWAKRRHIAVTAEATPHHLYLTSDKLAGGDATFKVNPPLRTAQDVEALRAGLADGTIDMIGTDHAPHLKSDKAKPLPLASPGMTGFEQALAVVIDVMVNTGRMAWADVARIMSTNPSRLLQVTTQGRPLRPGEPANLVLIDPTRRAIVRLENTASLARNNPYVGQYLPDPVVMTMWAGRVTYFDACASAAVRAF